jgi:predicted patatin/cPLA2 family phospholipase
MERNLKPSSLVLFIMRSKRDFDTLILEGGSLRCAFTAGVLDTFAVVGYNRFKRYYAVSAGTMALTSFLSGQRKHFIDVASHVVEDGQFIRFSSAFREEGLMNLAHLFDHVRRNRPLDIEAAAFATRAKDVRMVTTNHATGEPMYLRPNTRDWLRIMWASATLPMVTRGKIRVHDQWMFDGGISDALPLQAALDRGSRRILVIRTRPSGQHIDKGWIDTLATYWYRDNPAIVKLYTHGHISYNDTVDRLATGGEGRLKWEEIAPLEPLRSDGFRITAGQLLQDYHHGMAQALDWLASPSPRSRALRG